MSLLDENDDLPPSYSMLELFPDQEDGLPSFAEVAPQKEAEKCKTLSKKYETCTTRRKQFERKMKLFRSLDL